ncbi:MAG: imidazolonepropionase-like amidohydrolase [Roseivirga sp.]|jgi:imidazolonepropionase-like amidohydrolase
MMERWIGLSDPNELASDPKVKYINPNTISNWIHTKQNVLAQSDYEVNRGLQFNEIRRDILRQLHAAGEGILLGSGAPQVFNDLGFSIHREMEAMSKSGMSNFEILKSGTVNPTKYVCDETKYGLIQEGLEANLVLLEKNPLESIRHMKNPAGVMIRRTWISTERIDARSSRIARRYSH